MDEYPAELAALEALLDGESETAAEVLAQLDATAIQRLGHAAQDLVTVCHEAWMRRLERGI